MQIPQTPKFIMGDMDIDIEWETYLASLEQVGLAEYIQLEQAAYDAYIN